MRFSEEQLRLYAVTDLPEPDSPTMPRTSPSFILNETSFSALTSPAGVKNERRSCSMSTRYFSLLVFSDMILPPF